MPLAPLPEGKRTRADRRAHEQALATAMFAPGESTKSVDTPPAMVIEAATLPDVGLTHEERAQHTGADSVQWLRSRVHHSSLEKPRPIAEAEGK